MELLWLILIIGVPFLIVFVINKKQEQELKESFDEKLKDIDLSDYAKQEEQAIYNKINTLQNDLIFTKDYIKNLHSSDQIRILRSDELTRAYHYVYSKMPSAVSLYKRHKFIVLEFKDDLIFFIVDNKNKETLNNQPKSNEKFNFDNTLLDLIKEYYPHVQIGFETDNNDIRVFNTRNKAHSPINGLYRKKSKESSDTYNLEQEIFETQQNANYCSRCGNKLSVNAKFCNKCGYKINKD